MQNANAHQQLKASVLCKMVVNTAKILNVNVKVKLLLINVKNHNILEIRVTNSVHAKCKWTPAIESICLVQNGRKHCKNTQCECESKIAID